MRLCGHLPGLSSCCCPPASTSRPLPHRTCTPLCRMVLSGNIGSPELVAALQGVTQAKLFLGGQVLQAGQSEDLAVTAIGAGIALVLPSGQGLGLVGGPVPAVQLQCSAAAAHAPRRRPAVGSSYIAGRPQVCTIPSTVSLTVPSIMQARSCCLCPQISAAPYLIDIRVCLPLFIIAL